MASIPQLTPPHARRHKDTELACRRREIKEARRRYWGARIEAILARKRGVDPLFRVQ